jgi:D-cysteine desulfhydrase
VTTTLAADELPLVRRLPALAAIPRARLGTFPSPVEQLTGLFEADDLWIKRDDLNAPELGGNKVRSLEFLLGRVRADDTVLTVGGEGSTHVLATAIHAARLGARTIAVRWQHEMNPTARLVAARAAAACTAITTSRNAAEGYLRALARRLRGGVHYVPLGGAIPLGALGQVNAAMELADQIEAHELPLPGRVIVPLGTGMTAAGLALGFWLAGVETTVVGVRAGPRVGPTRWRVLDLARRTSRLITFYTGRSMQPVPPERVSIVHRMYAGAYGRPHPEAERTGERLGVAHGILVDATYSAKAFAVAMDVAAAASSPTLFWLTFDARWMRGAWSLSGSTSAGGG